MKGFSSTPTFFISLLGRAPIVKSIAVLSVLEGIISG